MIRTPSLDMLPIKALFLPPKQEHRSPCVLHARVRSVLDIDPQQILRQLLQPRRPAADQLPEGRMSAGIPNVPPRVSQHQGGQVVADGVPDQDLAVQQPGHVGLHLLQRAGRLQQLGGDAGDGAAVVGHPFLGPHKGVVQLLAVVVDEGNAGQRRLLRRRGPDAHHFAVDGDVLARLDRRREPDVGGFGPVLESGAGAGGGGRGTVGRNQVIGRNVVFFGPHCHRHCGRGIDDRRGREAHPAGFGRTPFIDGFAVERGKVQLALFGEIAGRMGGWITGLPLGRLCHLVFPELLLELLPVAREILEFHHNTVGGTPTWIMGELSSVVRRRAVRPVENLLRDAEL